MNESIGAKLRHAREQRRLTLEQVSETTKVRPHYLQALENDDLSAISSAAQARGFLRIYAGFLGLDAADLMLIKSPAEPALTVQQSISSSDQLLASVQDAASKNKSERPGLFSNLLNRFTRRTEKGTVTIQTTETASAAEIPEIPELKPFVPARVTEELPAAPDSPVEKPVSELTPMVTAGTPAIDSTPTVKVLKKTGSRPRKSSTHSDKQNDVKKKGNE